jgi:hypothetical protein
VFERDEPFGDYGSGSRLRRRGEAEPAAR